ncbi:MAG: DEAD/DEAH box helicase [Anaerolineales bacterium]|nr:DEAD/DEAH box helicase [Anaerolineales bacterium]
MKPEDKSRRALSITQSKAKLFEYGVPLEEHILLPIDPAMLFPLTIGLLGDLAARLNDSKASREKVQELSNSLPFSARFFDAFIETQLHKGNEVCTRLLGSAAYYLCDLLGSSNIMAERIDNSKLDLGGLGLEKLLTWLLLVKGFPTALPEIPDSHYKPWIELTRDNYLHYNDTGLGIESVYEATSYLRALTYEIGTPIQLLLADLIKAIVVRRAENSTWFCLPRYTDLPVSEWANIIRKDTFIKEFWPAQHLLGKKDVFKGKSAVIQMPTSAGKTKATEIIIRSAFLAKRASLAVIIAPFRALCHEIRQGLLNAFQGEQIYVDELSDVLQKDYSIDRILRNQNILVATPEKFNYLLRHDPDLAQHIGLIIYDEGHQFDNGTRGITYELLLTSLKAHILDTVQTVLISAVISNASQIGKWLIGEDAEIIEGINLVPTFKSLGFATIADSRRNLYFVNRDDLDNWEYFVPRIFDVYKLRHNIIFPHLKDGREIALFLGLKLVNQGNVAIFSGTKDSVGTICNTIVKAFRNGLPLQKPSDALAVNRVEIQKLKHLHDMNLGGNAIYSQSADLGIFAHHNNIPHGIRLAVEYAIKEGLANFVICTSTLAQGVNLPIRYLIVTSIYQGEDAISVRDFQNLIGRSGRSGMHTEGSILFADPSVYDQREHWRRVNELLDPSKSEECASQLLSLFEPLYDDYKSIPISIEPSDLVARNLQGKEAISSLITELEAQYERLNLRSHRLRRQIEQKINTISAIESYLMANWDPAQVVFNRDAVIALARGTFAYFLANEDQKEQIEILFLLLAQTIEEYIPNVPKRIILGKTTYGIPDSLVISGWLDEHAVELASDMDDTELFNVIWPLIAQNISNRKFIKCKIPEAMFNLAIAWLEGISYHELLRELKESGAQYVAGSQLRNYKIDHVVDICENGFAYEGVLVLGALIELLQISTNQHIDSLISNLQHLQKRFKYGLPNPMSIVLYELGFADRVVAIHLSSLFTEIIPDTFTVIRSLRAQMEGVFTILDFYPSYFSQVYKNVAT